MCEICRVRTRKYIFFFTFAYYHGFLSKHFVLVTNNSFPKIRIKDIAGIAGVSPGTVDRVLHNRGEVSENTRKRILGIIHELNYQPDILASALASKKRYRIAALIPEAKPGSTFWKYPLKGIEDGLREINHFGISLDMYYFDYFDRNSFLKQSARAIKDKPNGLILAPVFSEEASLVVKNCNDQDIPVVLINASVCMENCIAFVGQDSLQSGMVAAKLMDYGLRDNPGILIVNFIREEGKQLHLLKREEGFRNYYAKTSQAGCPVLDYLNVSDIIDRKKEKILKDAIFSSRIPISGIFVTNSRVFHVARFLEKNSINNITLIGYDLLEENKAYLRKGVIDFLISQKPREQGLKSLMTLYHHVVLKKEVEKNQYLPIDIITKENLEHYSFT